MSETSTTLTQATLSATTRIRELYENLAREILANLPIPQLEDDEPIVLSDIWRQVESSQNVQVRTLLISKLIGLSKEHAEVYQTYNRSHSEWYQEKHGKPSIIRKGIQAGLSDYLKFLGVRTDQSEAIEATILDWARGRSQGPETEQPSMSMPSTASSDRNAAVEGDLSKLGDPDHQKSIERISETAQQLSEQFELLHRSQTHEASPTTQSVQRWFSSLFFVS